MHQQLICALIEKALNKAFEMSDVTPRDWQFFVDQTAAIHIKELGFPICFSFAADRLLVTSIRERADCTVETSFSALMEMKQGKELTDLIRSGALDVQGEIKVVQHLSSLFERVNPDWQRELAQHIGDIPTYHVERIYLWLADKLRFAARQIKEDSTEYLVHELGVVVNRYQIAEFKEGVEQTSQYMTALEQRIAQLEQRINNPSS